MLFRAGTWPRFVLHKGRVPFVCVVFSRFFAEILVLFTAATTIIDRTGSSALLISQNIAPTHS